MACCFEIDLIGGWVGVLWDKFNGEPMKVKMPERVIERKWIRGTIRLVQRARVPERTKTEKHPDGSISFRVVLDRAEFERELDRLRTA
jgi:hypothetical protein